MKLSREEQDVLRDIFRVRPDGPCEDCGGYHLRACRRVKRREWHPNGNPIVVEYFQEWDDSDTIYPEDIFDDSDEGTRDFDSR